MRKKLLTASAAMVMLVGCTTGAPATAPTAQAVATQAQPTVQAIATQIGPTAQAVATQVAPTAQAVATQVSTPAAQAVGTVTEASPIQIADFNFDPTDTTITLRNTSSDRQVDLTGWQLRVGNEVVTLPNNAQVAPGQTLTLHTGQGTSMANDVYLGEEATNLLDSLRPGAEVALVNDQGNTVVEFVVPSTSA